MDSIIQFLGGIAEERDDEADFVDFLHEEIGEVVQLILHIMYQAFCVLGIPGEVVNCKFLWHFWPRRRLLSLMILLNKHVEGGLSSIVLVLIVSTPVALATAKEVAQIGG